VWAFDLWSIVNAVIILHCYSNPQSTTDSSTITLKSCLVAWIDRASSATASAYYCHRAAWSTWSVVFSAAMLLNTEILFVSSAIMQWLFSTTCHYLCEVLQPACHAMYSSCCCLINLTINQGLLRSYKTPIQRESRAAARKPRDAASVLFGWSSPTTFLTSIRLAMLRKPHFRAPNMLAQNTI